MKDIAYLVGLGSSIVGVVVVYRRSKDEPEKRFKIFRVWDAKDFRRSEVCASEPIREGENGPCHVIHSLVG